MRRRIANARIDLRTTPQRKHFFELAAFVGGYESLSSFMNEATELLAKKVLEEVEDSRELSNRDRDLVLNHLNNPPEPTPALKALSEKVAKMCFLDSNGETVYRVNSGLFKNKGE